MKIQQSILLLFFLACSPAQAFAQEPSSTIPNYDPNIPAQYGAGGRTFTVPLPPHLPLYTSNGAINLDEVWIRDGGARLYWNNVIIPTQLKMEGSYWIDPALVPQLLPEKKAPVRRTWRRARASAKPKKVKVPPNVSSTALKAPVIPLPVNPVEEAKIPPLMASPRNGAPAASTQAQSRPRADTEMPDVTPPPLQ